MSARGKRRRNSQFESLEPRRLLAVWPVGGISMLNGLAEGHQGGPAVASDAAGNHVVVWYSDTTGQADIVARRYDQFGSPIGSEFVVNSYTTGLQYDHAVAMDNSGNFVAVWVSAGQDGSAYGVYARRFNSAGVAQGTEFQVNTLTAGDQMYPAVAMDADGDFTIVFSGSTNGTQTSHSLYGRRYDSAGSALGTEFVIRSPQESAFTPTIAMNSLGSFVVTSQNYNGSGTAKWFDSEGVETGASGLQGTNAVAVIGDDGRTFFASSSVITYTTDRELILSIYRSDGSKVGQYFDYTRITQRSEYEIHVFHPGIGMDGQGRVVVAWDGLYAQRFDSNGFALGERFEVAGWYSVDWSSPPAISVADDGDFTIAWHGNSVEDTDGVFARRYMESSTNSTGTVSGRVWSDVDGDGVQDPGEGGIESEYIELYNLADVLIDTTRTDANGNYSFRLIPGESAYLKFLPQGRGSPQDRGSDSLDSDMNPSDFRSGTFSVSSAGQTIDLDAGMTSPVTLSGTVYFDRNNNGQRGDGEEGIGGFIVFADADLDGLLDSGEAFGVSGSAGNYSIAEVYPGNFKLTVVPTSLWTTPSSVSISVPSADLTRDFAVRTTVPDVPMPPGGEEFRVNTYTTHNQQGPVVAMAPNGDYVVIWSSGRFAQENTNESFSQDGSFYGVYAQRYNAAGVPQGAEFRVNTYTQGKQIAGDVAMDSQGNFVVVWASGMDKPGIPVAGPAVPTGVASNGGGSMIGNPPDNGPQPQDGSYYGIYAQRYSATGVPLGQEFRVNTYTQGTQVLPEIAMDADGDFIVVWEGGGPGDSQGVFARRFNSLGEALGDQFAVNSTTVDRQERASVAMDAAGNSIITWSSGSYPNQPALFTRRYNSSGNALSDEVLLLENASASSVVMSTAGDAILIYSSAHGNYAQRFDSAGASQGGPIPVGLNTSAVMNGRGDWIVTGHRYVGPEGIEVFARRFNLAGVPQGGEFKVNAYATNEQLNPSAGIDAAGNFVVVWEDFLFDRNARDGSSAGVYGRLFKAAPPVVEEPPVEPPIATELGVLVGGVLTIPGTDAGDVIAVEADGGAVRVIRNGQSLSYLGVQHINVYAGTGDDQVTIGPGLPATYVNGGYGNDTLTAGTGDDSLTGAAGADRLVGGAGNNRIDGGKHNDTVIGADGDDRLYGSEGHDSLEGGIGRDRMYGGPHNDRLLGGNQNDTIYGDEGDDWIDGGNHSDRLFAGLGRDSVFGNRGNDVIYAEDNLADLLNGGADQDIAFVDLLDTPSLVEQLL